MILGISGRAGSGKSSAADVLVRERGFVCVALADPLKRVAQELFGWDRERLWGPSELRNEPDPAWGGLTARRALQVLGTEVGRALHPDVWVRATMREIERQTGTLSQSPCALERCFIHDGETCALGHMSRGAHFVIPDVRFRNELDAIKAAGGVVLRVVRPGAGLGGEASETELTDDSDGYNAQIVNDGTLEEFEEKIAAFGGLLVRSDYKSVMRQIDADPDAARCARSDPPQEWEPETGPWCGSPVDGSTCVSWPGHDGRCTAWFGP